MITTHNAAIALETLVLKITMGTGYINSVRPNDIVLFDRWMT